MFAYQKLFKKNQTGEKKEGFSIVFFVFKNIFSLS